MTPCKNCGRGIHQHWTGGWIHDEPTPSGNYLYCGFRAEREATDVVADAPDSAPDDAIGADSGGRDG